METKIDLDPPARTVALPDANPGLLERTAEALLDAATLEGYRCDLRAPGAARGIAMAG